MSTTTIWVNPKLRGPWSPDWDAECADALERLEVDKDDYVGRAQREEAASGVRRTGVRINPRLDEVLEEQARQVQAHIAQMAADLGWSVAATKKMIRHGHEVRRRREAEHLCGPGGYVELEPVANKAAAAPILAAVLKAFERDATPTWTVLADEVEMSRSDLQRALGYKARQTGKFATGVNRELAARVARAINADLHELDL